MMKRRQRRVMDEQREMRLRVSTPHIVRQAWFGDNDHLVGWKMRGRAGGIVDQLALSHCSLVSHPQPRVTSCTTHPSRHITISRSLAALLSIRNSRLANSSLLLL